jgi:RNA polymerase sigma-70 factor (ECF subfamily)
MISFFVSMSQGRLPKTGPAPEDAELIDRCRRGDRSAFDSLVESYQNRIFNFCFMQLGSSDDAADAAQESFVRAWRFIAKFRHDCTFSTWLHRIAINVTRDTHGRRTSLPLPFSGLTENDDEVITARAAQGADPAAQPSEQLLFSERRQAVSSALAALSTQHRLVLVLFDIEGNSYEEVATILQLPLGTVKSRLSRARQALRLQLEPWRELFED